MQKKRYARLPLAFVIGAAALLYAVPSASGQPFERMLRRADLIVQAHVEDVSVENNNPAESVELVRLRVTDTVAGQVPGERLTVTAYPQRGCFASPRFRKGEEVIVVLNREDGAWRVMEHYLKFVVTGSTIGGGSITVDQFKAEIKRVVRSESPAFSFPFSAFAGADASGASSSGSCRLTGTEQFCPTTRYYGPLSGQITLHIDPAGAKNQSGSPVPFSAIKAVVDNAVQQWNSVPHAHTYFSVSNQPYDSQTQPVLGVSIIRFVDMGDANGQAEGKDRNGDGVLDEVDVVLNNRLRWNTSTSYSEGTLYANPFDPGVPTEADTCPLIGAVDMWDVLIHELGHGVGLAHPAPNGSTELTMSGTDYTKCSSQTAWWKKTYRRNLMAGDKLGKIYMAPSFPGGASTQQFSRVIVGAPPAISVSGDFTVGSGKTLEVEQGTSLRFASGKRLTVNGTLNATGATFTASGSSWDGLRFAAGSSGTLDASTIEKVRSGTNAGAIVIDDASPTIRKSTVRRSSVGPHYGLQVLGAAAEPALQDNTLQGISAGAVFDDYSDAGPVYENDISASASGGSAVIARGNADLDLVRRATNPGQNKLRGGPSGNGLYAYGGANVTAGESSTLKGENHFCPEHRYDVKASSATVYARYNYWPSSTPRLSGSYINASNVLGTSDCGASGSFRVASAGEIADLSAEPGVLVASVEGGGLVLSDAQAPGDFEAMLLQARALARGSTGTQRLQAIALLKQIVEGAAERSLTVAALQELGELAGRGGASDLIPYVEGYAAQEGPLQAPALATLVGVHQVGGDEAAALEAAGDLARVGEGTWYAFHAQMSASHLHRRAGRYEEAAQALAEARPLSAEEEEMLAAAEALLSEEVGGAVDEAPLEAVESQLLIAEKAETPGGLEATSYPNPFNPVTTIRYRLPAEARVLLQVFDVLGRAVATLVEAPQPAGPHEARFDGSRLASGLYVYRLEAGGEVLTGQMLLLK